MPARQFTRRASRLPLPGAFTRHHNGRECRIRACFEFRAPLFAPQRKSGAQSAFEAEQVVTFYFLRAPIFVDAMRIMHVLPAQRPPAAHYHAHCCPTPRAPTHQSPHRSPPPSVRRSRPPQTSSLFHNRHVHHESAIRYLCPHRTRRSAGACVKK